MKTAFLLRQCSAFELFISGFKTALNDTLKTFAQTVDRSLARPALLAQNSTAQRHRGRILWACYQQRGRAAGHIF